MTPKDVPPTMSPQLAIIMMLLWVFIMGAMILSYAFMLIAFWKGMRAHQKIAEALKVIAEKLPVK